MPDKWEIIQLIQQQLSQGPLSHHREAWATRPRQGGLVGYLCRAARALVYRGLFASLHNVHAISPSVALNDDFRCQTDTEDTIRIRYGYGLPGYGGTIRYGVL